MTAEQKFVFDLKGWLLLPGVLSGDEITELTSFFTAVRHDPQSLPPADRVPYGGPAGALMDHPAVVDVLRELIAGDVNERSYGFRLDGTYLQYRQPGSDGIDPHGGGPTVGPNFAYQCRGGRMYSGLTRVVWELTDVAHGQGGTLLMSGSHKANFGVPDVHRVKDSWLFETYACPAGSVLLFTENLCHSGAAWQMPHPRIALFNCYTHGQAQYHKSHWQPQTIAAWPAKRRTLVRGVWGNDFRHSPALPNDWYGADNRAY